MFYKHYNVLVNCGGDKKKSDLEWPMNVNRVFLVLQYTFLEILITLPSFSANSMFGLIQLWHLSGTADVSGIL